jgi:hypothetical protein
MLVFDLGGFSDSKIDYEFITVRASRLGVETHQLWLQLLTRAKEELGKQGT